MIATERLKETAQDKAQEIRQEVLTLPWGLYATAAVAGLAAGYLLAPDKDTEDYARMKKTVGTLFGTLLATAFTGSLSLSPADALYTTFVSVFKKA